MTNKGYSRIKAVDADTNEVLGNVLLKRDGSEDLELKVTKVCKLTPAQKAYLNAKVEFKEHCSNLGGFIHMIYAKNEKLFNNANLDKANISRIIYLATYMDYEQKGLVIHQLKDKYGKFLSCEAMNKKTIQSVLNLGDTAFKKFLKNMKDNNIIFEVKKKIYINTEYFVKGIIEDFDDNNKGYCRLFINTVRNLYEGCKPTRHKVLSSVYQLMPFVHYSNNMICHNPDGLESNAIPMSLKDIGNVLNIEDNKGNLNKLMRELSGFTVTFDTEYKLLSYVRMYDKDFYFVNPYIVYSGNDINKLRWVADTYFFRG